MLAKRNRKEYVATGMFPNNTYKPPEIKYPITPRENLKLLLDKRQPVFIPNTFTDIQMLMPVQDPDCHLPVFEDGYDGFGTHWTYVPAVGAQMVTPGTCALKNIERWRQDLRWPHLDQYDFTLGMHERMAALDPCKMHFTLLGHGLFERLHSCIGFQNALESFIISPEAVHDFFDALTNWKLEYLKKLFAAAPGAIDIVTYADDMGTQRDTFFSPSIFEEFFFPRVKKIFEFIHNNGMYVNFHSCGNNERFIQYYTELGVDYWECQRDCNDHAAITDLTHGRLGICLGLDAPLLSDPETTDDDLIQHTRTFIDETSRFKNYLASVPAVSERVANLILPELVRYSCETYSRSSVM